MSQRLVRSRQDGSSLPVGFIGNEVCRRSGVSEFVGVRSLIGSSVVPCANPLTRPVHRKRGVSVGPTNRPRSPLRSDGELPGLFHRKRGVTDRGCLAPTTASVSTGRRGRFIGNAVSVVGHPVSRPTTPTTRSGRTVHRKRGVGTRLSRGRSPVSAPGHHRLSRRPGSSWTPT